VSSGPSDITTDDKTSPRRIRTLIADDSPIALESLCRFLSTQHVVEIVGTARDGCAALEQTQALRPELLLVDLQMPGLNGLEVSKIVTKDSPAPQVIVISAHDSPTWIALSRTAGARAFVPKNRIHNELLTAIQTAFPRADGPPAFAPAVKPPPSWFCGHGECILVVDDEAPVLKLALRTLEAHGYHALLAQDGTEALFLFLQHRHKIKAVLTDLVMPFMDGLALIRALKKVEPQVRVVASSGMGCAQGPHSRLPELSALGVGRFLSKPYKAIELLQTLRETIDAPPENHAIALHAEA
jgi:CheY-like chemotaxis protein